VELFDDYWSTAQSGNRLQGQSTTKQLCKIAFACKTKRKARVVCKIDSPMNSHKDGQKLHKITKLDINHKPRHKQVFCTGGYKTEGATAKQIGSYKTLCPSFL
jgi:hypothetical protein